MHARAKSCRCSVLAQHLAVAQVLVLVNGHVVGLRCDVDDDVRLVAVFVHGPLVVREGLTVLMSVVAVEEDTKALDTNAAEYTENVSLVFVELCSGVSGRI